MSTGAGSGEDELEQEIRQLIKEYFAVDVEVRVLKQGDSYDVHVDFPAVTEEVAGAVDAETVQSYSTLKLTVSRR